MNVVVNKSTLLAVSAYNNERVDNVKSREYANIKQSTNIQSHQAIQSTALDVSSHVHAHMYNILNLHIYSHQKCVIQHVNMYKNAIIASVRLCRFVVRTTRH